MLNHRSMCAAAALTLTVMLAACGSESSDTATELVVASEGQTLALVRERGKLLCQVGTPIRGFYYTTTSQESTNDQDWAGFDVDVCRAIAAAVLGDASKVDFVSVTAKSRFTSLTRKSLAPRAPEPADVLSRTTTWTMSRDTHYGVDFPVITFYDDQQFMVPSSVDPGTRLKDYLKNRTVCVQDGTTTLVNLSDYSEEHGLNVEPTKFEDAKQRDETYKSGGECDALTNDGASLRATLAEMDPEDRDQHIILKETISREPLGPAVREGDSQWSDIVRWTVLAMILAEKHNITKDNIGTLGDELRVAEVRRLLGKEGNLHKGLGLDASWAHNVVNQVGNYAEMYERNLGGDAGSSINIPREGTANELWQRDGSGGLLYVPPFR